MPTSNFLTSKENIVINLLFEWLGESRFNRTLSRHGRCSPLVPIKNKIKLTGAEHEKLLCWHWFVVRGRGRRIQEEIKITLTLRLVVVAGERRDVGCHPWGDRYPDR
jgi:hypothetical protein